MGETPTQFEKAAAEITGWRVNEVINKIAKATPKQVALICRQTFDGVETLLEPLLMGGLSDRAIQSVEDSNDSLTYIYREYMKLRKKGAINNGILDEIKLILPDLSKALPHISSAVGFLHDLDLQNNKVEYYEVLSVYKQHILNTYEPIVSININIRGRANVDLGDDNVDTG